MRPLPESDFACFYCFCPYLNESKLKPQYRDVTLLLKTQQTLCALQVLELDVMDVRIVEERSYAATIETSSDSYNSYAARIQRRHFLYFTDEKIFSLLMEICRTLGMSAL